MDDFYLNDSSTEEMRNEVLCLRQENENLRNKIAYLENELKNTMNTKVSDSDYDSWLENDYRDEGE